MWLQSFLCVLVALLLWARPSAAQTVRYVNTASTAGGDCTTNLTAGSTRACATLRQAVDLMPSTLTTQWTIYCSGTTADTSDLDQGAWDMVTTATNYIHIIGEQSPNHPTSTPTGMWDTNLYRLEATNRNAVYNNIPAHIRYEGLQVQMTVTDTDSYVLMKTTNQNQTVATIDNRIAYNILRCVLTDGSGIGIESRPPGSGGGQSYVYNNIVTGCTTGINTEFLQTKVYNNTAYNNQFNFNANAANSMVAINNIAAGTADQHFLVGGSYSSGSGWNAAPDTSPPGSNNLTNVNFTGVFVNAAAGNFHLASGTHAVATSGSVNPGAGLYTDDIDGQARGASWAIGADEFLAAAYNQVAYRFRNDDGSESAATWAAAENTALNRGTLTATRLRLQTDTTAADPPTQALKLQYKRSTDATWLAVPVASPLAVTLDLPVNLGTNDAQQIGTAMTLTGTTIGGSLDAITDWAGMRWTNVAIPVGATITTAYLRVVPSGTGEDEPLVTVFLENADNPGTFTTGASDISNRTRTTGVSWSNTELSASGSNYFNSPSLVSDLQTVVNRGGWAPGNALVVLVQGGATTTRDLTIESFENTGNNPPILHVEFTVPTAFELVASANVTASGETTTRQITIPAGKASGDFDGGRLQDDENPGDTVDVTLDGFREDEWVLRATATAVADATYQFRLVDSAETVLDTYTVTPAWTISAGESPPPNFFTLRRRGGS